MEITLGKDHSIYIAAKSAHIAVGQKNEAAADVFFATESGTSAAKAKKYFSSPGEYEVQGAMVDGVMTGEKVVSYHMIVDGVRYAAISLNGVGDLTDAVAEKLQPADVVLLWLKEGKTEDIVGLFARIEANYLIPVQIPMPPEDLEKDLQLKAEVLPKLKLTTKDFAEEKRALIVLTQ